MFHKAPLVIAILAAVLSGSAAQASLPSGIAQSAADDTQDITLTFTSTVDPRRSHVRVFGPNGEVPVGKVHLGEKGNDLVIPIVMELQPGSYTVHFEAYSVIGQSVQGVSELTVLDPAPLAEYSWGLPSR